MKKGRYTRRGLAILLAGAMLLSSTLLAVPAAAAETEGNLALNKTATATFEQDDNNYKGSASNAVDGNLSTRWSSYGSGQTLPQAIQIDLGEKQELGSVVSYWYKDGRTYTYNLYLTNEPTFTDDGFTVPTGTVYTKTDLTAVGSGDADKNSPTGTTTATTVDFAPVTAQYITLYCTKASSGSAAGICEIEAYATARNLALGKAVTASSVEAGNDAKHAVDGNNTTRWAVDYNQDQDKGWLQIDLEQVYALDRLEIDWFTSTTKRIYRYNIAVSMDGETFGQALDCTQNTISGNVVNQLNGVCGRYVRISITGNSDYDNKTLSGWKQKIASLYEVRAYGEAVPAKLAVVGDGVVTETADGGQVSLTAQANADSSFIGYRVNDTFKRGTEEAKAITVPATGNQKVTAYFAKTATETVTVFYGQQNRVVDVKVFQKEGKISTSDLPTAPTVNGKEFSSWDTTSEELQQAVDSSDNGFSSAQALYRDNGTVPTYTITVTNAEWVNQPEGTTTVSFNDRIEVKPAGTGAFSYWTLDGAIVSYNPDSYTFYACGNHTVQAVYNASDAAPNTPTIVVPTTMVTKQTEDKNTFSLITAPVIPEGADILEYGVLFAPQKKTLERLSEDSAALTEGRDYLRVISSETTPNVQHKFDLRGVKTGASRYGLAYLIVRQGDTTQTVYSEIQSNVVKEEVV